MKTILSSILIFAALAPGLPHFENSECSDLIEKTELTGKHTKEKKIKKEFKVSADSKLNIDNSYGNVDITTWNENRVVIEVIVKTNGNDEEEVEKKLEEINVEFNQDASGVTAKTRFSKSEKSWWKNLFEGFDNVNMEVNYMVRAPEGNHLGISNDYGGIYIDKTTGNTSINCDYGKLDLGELRGKANALTFDYTRSSSIDYVTNAAINADYSDYEIKEAEQLVITADYSKSKIGKVSKLEYNCDYGSVEVDKVKVLIGNGDYLTTKINRVFTSADLNMDYGSLSIEKVIKGARNINIDTDYAGVKLGYDNEMDFDFNVKTSYGGINGLEQLQVQKQNQGNSNHTVSGYYGQSGSGTQINISTSYGSVKFYKQ
ncbi:hypothetical protein GCM10023115_56620 [Pontixanthobacter gangjinensis]|uniref:DUF4097 domain-containing protein n=1 Tax=Christiangramia aestuarii TaxID=1028746 RepID=A0A7K1LSM1_9FLAO|nr:hypothetical protein [Christiangramia aestuarii]MUP43815.1 DUF4097 domain-containing protein [Christiangramia aestuarii]